MRCEWNINLLANEKEASQNVEGDFHESEKLNSHYNNLPLRSLVHLFLHPEKVFTGIPA